MSQRSATLPALQSLHCSMLILHEISYCSILLHHIDLTLCSPSCCLCATSVNICSSCSLCLSLHIPT
jgi:hypothetical protein